MLLRFTDGADSARRKTRAEAEKLTSLSCGGVTHPNPPPTSTTAPFNTRPRNDRICRVEGGYARADLPRRASGSAMRARSESRSARTLVRGGFLRLLGNLQDRHEWSKLDVV